MNSIVGLSRRFDRRLYLGASFIFLALVFWTFARTFYLRRLFGTPPMSGLLHVHGAVMTGWVVLLVVQSSLIAARRVHWHRRLGVLGAAWAHWLCFSDQLRLCTLPRAKYRVTQTLLRVRSSSRVWIYSRCFFLQVSSQLQFGSAVALTITSA